MEIQWVGICPVHKDILVPVSEQHTHLWWWWWWWWQCCHKLPEGVVGSTHFPLGLWTVGGSAGWDWLTLG